MEGEAVKIKIEKFGRNQKVEDRVGLRRVYIQSDTGLHDCQGRGRDFYKTSGENKMWQGIYRTGFCRIITYTAYESTLSKKDTLKEAILLAKTSNSVTAQKSMAILYTLADKFLDNCDLEEIKSFVRN